MRFSASGRTIPLVSGEISFSGYSQGNTIKVRHPSIDRENSTNNRPSWKRRKIGGTLLLITNRKSHMGFLLISKLVTLNDLERRNGPVVCVISPKLVALGPYYVKVVEDAPIHSTREM